MNNFIDNKLFLIVFLLTVSTGCLLFFVPQGLSKNIDIINADINTQQLITLTNQVREVKNLNSLTINEQLNKAAQTKAQDLIKYNFFSHNSPDGKYFSTWIEEAGYQYQIIGENLATGYQTNKEVMKAWMDSPSHKANILNEKYREIGMAVLTGKLGNYQQIIVVQIFGAPKTRLLTEQFDLYNKYNPLRLNFSQV